MATSTSKINAAKAPSEESTSERSICAQKCGYWNNVLLNIAVIGETKTGKSTFINAIRGLKDDDEDAAKTGIAETTTNPTPYEHPRMPRVVFWDIPGRFRENDIMLAKEIQKRKKQFYFIRSKIDNDIESEAGKRNFNREETLSKIRRDCEENLKEIQNARVFLISSKNLSEYDFEALVFTLMSDLPEQKQKALLQSVPVSSLAILEKKVKMFEKAAWAAAFLSGGTAVVPVPGLSLACDASILVAFFTSCYHSFGLDDKSLDRLAERVNKPHLKSLIKSPLVLGLASKSAVRLQMSALAGQSVVEYLFSLVPGVGSGIAALMSFGCTYSLLQKGLKELADTTRAVLREAGLQ